MSAFSTQALTDLRALTAEEPNTAVIGVQTITVSKGKLSHEKIYSDYGYGDQYRMSITGARADLTAIPVKGTNITVGGVTYQTLNDDSDSLGVAFILHLGEAIS